jgi:outer membrane immunogenic protein
MNRLALAVPALSLAVAAPALAADLPSRYAPAPYYSPAPIFTFNGLYAGVNGAFAFGSVSTNGHAAGFGGPVGGLGGGTIGYNYQQGTLLVGVEADIAFGSISSPASYGVGLNSGATIHGMGTARARLGYVWDRTLFFVTGGYAGMGMNGSVADFSGRPSYVLNESHYLNGYAVGAGVEFAVTTKITVKGEYLYTDFASQGYFPGTRDGLVASPHINLLRAGVNYHF